MKKGYTDITAILDRSGSMSSLREEVVGAFNSFIDDQKKASGTATMTLVQFDHLYQVDYDAIDINDVPPIVYVPRGMTAMNDAIGRTIVSTGNRLGDMDECDRPEKVIILIQTDGYENASKEYTANTIKKMVQEQESKYSWEFVFLGSNLDAKDVASGIGIKSNNAMTYASNSDGLSRGITSVSENLTQFRGGSKSDMSYIKEDYNAQVDAGV